MADIFKSIFGDPAQIKSICFGLVLVGLAGNLVNVSGAAERHKFLKKLLLWFLLLVGVVGAVLGRFAETWAQPRWLSIHQQAELRSILAPFGKRNAFVLASTAAGQTSDIEPFATQMKRVLTDAGWTLTGLSVDPNVPANGVVVSTAEESEKQTIAAVESLVRALNEFGISATIDPRPFSPKINRGLIPPSPDIQILVGSKP
ncbi:hypothetical protein ACQR1Y_11565 [Bradyrhizobium sp. HKCCYLRH3099]|uniref:hypothetical protein n=1 Tax=unclassified Bradyrhizobium TaxID=2631580 RepID=UPI003EB809BB